MFDVVTNEFEVTIGDHGGGISAKVNDKLRECEGNGVILHVFQWIDIFVAGFAVD